jgi:ribosomal protein S18 acetylase RimI-like enzyme
LHRRTKTLCIFGLDSSFYDAIKESAFYTLGFMMTDTKATPTLKPIPSVELVDQPLSMNDLNDLCDATDAAIAAGGGFGWIKLPNRDILERFWQGVVTIPTRKLFLARLDGVVCGTAQLIKPPKNNEAQAFTAQITGLFIAPWARGQGLSRRLLDYVEKTALKEGVAVINLDVRATQDAAIALYESAGYQKIGEHPAYAKVNDEIIKGIYYYKAIDPSLKL